MKVHEYAIALAWEDSTGRGTADYASYSRRFRAGPPGKPATIGSADPAFRGDQRLLNPEEMLVMSLSSCHMLSYLALCALRHVRVVSYSDAATGRMRADRDGGRFDEVVLRPDVVVADERDLAIARELHERAHASCYIASSVGFPVRHEATVRAGTAVLAAARKDLAARLPDRPGALGELGAVLGRAGVSLEGGGGFAGVVHFLVRDADAATAALRGAGIEVLGVRDVLELRLDQQTPGELGAVARALGAAGVNIETIYTDHDHVLIVVVDDAERARP
ncbi:MAG TPA: OsmC family protein, partial [Kofleriaceae bacterium]|nr:OsmC family protein [Kofleriaceae bacterium]